jgi:glycerophosphoryl diester phosphodiesterase
MTQTYEQDIFSIKNNLDERINKKARAEGELAAQTKRLNEEFNCKSIEEAIEFLEELQEERNEIKIKLENKLKEAKDLLGE